jgi:Nickel responsive protein SCO4226-like
MPNFLVESYLADAPAAVELARERARAVADEEAGVRYVRTTFIPGDETILHVFEAPSLAALRRAARRGALAFDRIVETVEDSVGSTRQPIHSQKGDSR